MNLILLRKWFTNRSVTGELWINDSFQSFTLEDVPREEKIPGETAIPEGTYQVIITPSVRFKRDLPLLENVPGFSGVRIHSGNAPEDTQGCILVGKYRGRDYIGQSRDAFNELFSRMQTALDSGEIITLTISHKEEVSSA